MPFRHAVCVILASEVIVMRWYYALFNAVTDALNALERVRELLVSAQQEAEELFLEGED